MAILFMPIYYKDELGNKHITFKERVSLDDIPSMIANQGSYVFNCQQLMNPIPEEEQIFDMKWIKYWKRLPRNLSIMICVDPASTANKSSDYTAITVHGFDEAQNWYILDIYRDKLKHEADRARKLFSLHQKWSKHTKTSIPVYYETLGFQVMDKHFMERKMKEDDYHFNIHELKGGKIHSKSKSARIRALQPYFEANSIVGKKRILLPQTCVHKSKYESKSVDMVQELLYEIQFFTPMMTHKHDDLLDSLSFPLYTDRFRNIQADSVNDYIIQDIATQKQTLLGSYLKKSGSSSGGLPSFFC